MKEIVREFYKIRQPFLPMNSAREHGNNISSNLWLRPVAECLVHSGHSGRRRGQRYRRRVRWSRLSDCHRCLLDERGILTEVSGWRSPT